VKTVNYVHKRRIKPHTAVLPDVRKIWGIESSEVSERHAIIIFACHLEFYLDLNCLWWLFSFITRVLE